MDFTGSLINEFNSLPRFWWLWLIVAGMITGLISWKRGLKLKDIICRVLLTVYVLFILFETVLGRPVRDYQPIFIPFWSYAEPSLRVEIILNYLLFIPLGILLYLVFGSKLGMKVVLIGLGLSVVIEIIQLITSVGLFEFDDIFGNAIGCLLGALIGKVVYRKCWN